MIGQYSFEQERLENGLTIVAEIAPWAPSLAMGVFVRVGSRDEQPFHAGISHFLEHVIFKGDCSRPADSVSSAFHAMQSRGRGFTSEECTAYYAYTAPEHQTFLLELWAALLEPALRPDDLEEARQTVLREIEDRVNEPSLHVADMARQAHFGEHPCGKSALGMLSTVGAIESTSIRDHCRRWYVPSNMILACTGNVNWDALIRKACTLFGSLPASRAPAREVAECLGMGAAVHAVREGLSRRHICFAAAAPPAQSPLSHASLVLADMIGGSVLSRLYGEGVPRCLAERVEAKYDALDGTGAYYVYISGYPGQAEQIAGAVERTLERMRAGDTGKEALRASKRRLIARIVNNCKMPQRRLVPMALGCLYRGDYLSPDAEIDAIDCVCEKDVQNLLEGYSMERLAMATLGPSGTL